jgi:hypothetical protein
MQLDSKNKAVPTGYPQYTHSFEPLLRSVEVMQPTMDIFDSADVVSNASNLRKLFHLLSNKTETAERYDLEWRGKTLLLSKWGGDPSLLHSFGCGAGFEKETCHYAPDDDAILQRSTSHHRVVSYRFAGLQCVVQSEVDAYYCSCDHSERPTAPIAIPSAPIPIPSQKKKKKRPSSQSYSPSSWRATPSPLPSPPKHQHSPSSAFALLTLDDPGDSPTLQAAKPALSPLRPPTPPPDPPTTPTPIPIPTTKPTTKTATLLIHHTGTNIPSPCLLEVKTQRLYSPPAFTPSAQLYFARRTKLYMAQHKRGLFDPQQALLVEGQVQDLGEWEAREQGTLRRLAGLLRVVRGRVERLAAGGERRVERVSLVCLCDGRGGDEGVVVRLFERGGGGRLLPEGC